MFPLKGSTTLVSILGPKSMRTRLGSVFFGRLFLHVFGLHSLHHDFFRGDEQALREPAHDGADAFSAGWVIRVRQNGAEVIQFVTFHFNILRKVDGRKNTGDSVDWTQSAIADNC